MDWPWFTLVDAGVSDTFAGCPAHAPNGVPSTFRPGENRRAGLAVVCSTNASVMSGDRVIDCELLPSSPVEPPYANCAMRFPAESRTKIVRPVFVSDKPLDEVALKTWAQPKTGAFGLKLPPPNTTAAVPGAKDVPAGKVNRVVSVVLPFARVLTIQPPKPIVSLVLPLTNSTNSSSVPSRTPSLFASPAMPFGGSDSTSLKRMARLVSPTKLTVTGLLSRPSLFTERLTVPSPRRSAGTRT